MKHRLAFVAVALCGSTVVVQFASAQTTAHRVLNLSAIPGIGHFFRVKTPSPAGVSADRLLKRPPSTDPDFVWPHANKKTSTTSEDGIEVFIVPNKNNTKSKTVDPAAKRMEELLEKGELPIVPFDSPRYKLVFPPNQQQPKANQ